MNSLEQIQITYGFSTRKMIIEYKDKSVICYNIPMLKNPRQKSGLKILLSKFLEEGYSIKKKKSYGKPERYLFSKEILKK